MRRFLKREETDEWCVFADENGRIREVEIGGCDQWVMKGHAFLAEPFTAKLCAYLEEAMRKEASGNLFREESVYPPQGKSWSCIRRSLKIRKSVNLTAWKNFGRLIRRYLDQTGSAIMENLADILQCTEGEIRQIYPLKQGNQVVGIEFDCRGVKYRYEYAKKQIGRYEK